MTTLVISDPNVDTEPQSQSTSLTPTKQTSPSLLDLYKSYCQEAACRPNSAVMALLKLQQPPNRPLQSLIIPNSYLGSKGLSPVMRLVAHCPTLEVLDLRGNGIDNEGAGLICNTLTSHLGITHISLDANPITNEGGRRLMQLVDRNVRILSLSLRDTDVYDSLKERMAQSLEKHGGKGTMGGEDGVVAARSRSSSSAAQSGDATGQSQPANSTLSPPPPLLLVPSKPPMAAPPQRAASRPLGSATSTAGKSPSIALTNKRGNSPSIHSSHDEGPVANTMVVMDAPKPKPPPPAVASRDYASRMSEQQRLELLRKYEERAKTYEAVATSEASRAADRTRLELMRVEQHRAKSPDGDDSKLRRLSRPSSRAATPLREESVPASRATLPTGGSHDHLPNLEPSTTASFTVAEREKVPVHRTNVVPTLTSTANGNNRKSTRSSAWSVTELPLGHEDDDALGENGDQLTGDDSYGGPPTVASTEDSDTHLSVIPLTLSKEEQFKQLFARGCSHYNERKLDAAYLSWNEALEIASVERNREWMAVVSSNLQRLSYELLVAEGAKHLETFNLEDADKTFQLALDVAVKSKNAAWEAEMVRAKRNVQHAVFQRSHDSALLLFEKAKNIKDQPVVTADDRFVESGQESGQLHTHTTAFVTEWSRLLYVKEAVEMWSDAAMVARRIGGTSYRQLLDIVNAAVSNVAALLTKKFFITEPSPNHLPLQGTSRFTFAECNRLIGLWTDLISKSQTTLGNRTWDAVAAAELGHLYLATHQLPMALQFFERVIDYGSTVQSPLLMGCGHTYTGLVHWQRSNYAVAERSFLSAMEYWKALRLRGVGDDRPVVAEDSDVTSATEDQSPNALLTVEGNSAKKGTPPTPLQTGLHPRGSVPDHPHIALEGYVTLDYINSMMSRCYHHLVGIQVSTHRYREALEALEQSLLHKYHDRLHEKLLRNFTPKPTLDHITAVAASIDTPLLYYEVAYRFEWNVATQEYDSTQTLCTWVVPRSGDIKVVTMNVSREFGVASIESVVNELRTALCVDPLNKVSTTALNGIHEELPDKAWMPALRLLYQAFIHPIADFLKVQDSEATTKLGTLTIIPSGILWGVPFNALLGPNNRYLIEDYALQLNFSAVQLAFAVLSARRVQERGLTKRAVVVQPDVDMVHRNVNTLDVTFPFDAPRSQKEGLRVAESLTAASASSLPHTSGSARRPSEALASSVKIIQDAAASNTNINTTNNNTTKEGGATGATTTTTTTKQNLAAARETDHVIENHDVLMELLPTLRFLHLSVATTSQGGPIDDVLLAPKDDGSTGGFYVATEGFEELRFVRSADISQRDTFAELVVMSCTNMLIERSRGTREGILNLVRAFLCSGVAGVIAGIWCTPDMVPSELFERFYRCVLTQERHKAKAMALAVRQLLHDDRLRYAPRLWSGYFVVGCPIV